MPSSARWLPSRRARRAPPRVARRVGLGARLARQVDPVVFFVLAAARGPIRRAAHGCRRVPGRRRRHGRLSTWRYGLDWVRALGPLADNAVLETSYALPSRLEQLGVPEDAAIGLASGRSSSGSRCWAKRRARDGSTRPSRVPRLAATPYLAVWYLAWAVPLAAPEDDDRAARLGALALTAYLLPQTIPR